MRTFPFVTVLAILVAPSIARGQDPERMAEALKDCDKNQMTINFCARHAFDVADAELNRVYKTLLATMSTPKSKERLKQAQRAWVTFRDKDCLVLVGPPESGGSMYQGLWWNCVEQRTQERVLELKKLAKLLKCEEQPCPPSE